MGSLAPTAVHGNEMGTAALTDGLGAGNDMITVVWFEKSHPAPLSMGRPVPFVAMK